MTVPGDAGARERALDPGRSFIVKAPAGSGKTSLLVARYLRLLAGAERPEEVVAITFTRKATAEMRARVLESLAAARGPAPADAHEARLHALAAAVATRDRTRDWDLEDNPQRLAIHTIDALCASLARRLPVVSGLGGPLATTEDPSRLYQGAARRTLLLLDDARTGGAVARVLDHLDGNMAAFETLLAEMLARRDQWMRYLRLDEPRARREELEAGLRAAVESGLAAAVAALPAAQAAELARLAVFAAGRAAAIDGFETLAPLAGLAGFPGATALHLPAWKGLAELLLTAGGTLRKQPMGKVFTAQETRAEYDAMRTLLAELAAGPDPAPALATVRGLPAPAYDDTQWAVLTDLFQVLEVAVASLRLEFAAQGACDFTEQVFSASLALGEEHAPTDLALALDYRIRHLLVDEFQDTSASHFEIVRKLTAGWSPDDGRSLFLVGDPMQSIYRFREAEVGLFLACYQGALDTVELTPLALGANFRSAAGVVEWVNRGFPAILPPRDDPVRAAAAYEPSEATRPADPGDAVQVHAAVDDGAEGEGQRVAEAVARIRAEALDRSIAILLRARGHGAAIIAALEARGLAWRGVDLQPLSGVPAVQDLHALASALLHPLDRVSWLAVLRAPWCGLTLDDLEALVADDAGGALAPRLQDAATLRRLSADGRERLARVAPVLGEAATRAGRERVAPLTARTWRALGGPACLGGARLEDARRYLALLAGLEGETGTPDPDELARRTAALFAAPRPGEVDVEIMTIHKAKGLEFDEVVLPALHRVPGRESPSMLAWSETATAAGASLLLAPLPPPEGEDHSPLHRFVRGIERDKRRLETARLLYVACTRARHRLHLFGAVAWKDGEDAPSPPRGDSLLAHLWPAVSTRFRDLRPPPRAPAPAPAAEPTIRRLPLDWTMPSAPPSVATPRAGVAPAPSRGVEFSWAGQTARHVGVVAHAALRRIAAEGAAGRDEARLAASRPAWRRALAALGVPREALDEALEAVACAVAATLADETGRWLLDGSHADARSEYALTGLVGGALVSGVLDRTFVDVQGTRWIVDYKTGSHGGGGLAEFLDREQARYRGQLERYACLMHALEPRPIRLALYFPAASAWRAWDFEPAA